MIDERRVICAVFVFPNGMVAVTDNRGQQVPDLQGRWEEKKAEIVEAVAEKYRRHVEVLRPGEKWETPKAYE